MEVRLEGVCVHRGPRRVLDIDALTLRAGRTTAILGPNGAGKTTLLRTIAGLEQPREGRITIEGAAPAANRHDLGYVFQEQVFLRRTVRENLALGLRLQGVPPAAADIAIHDALQWLGSEHLIDRRANQLSVGEGRRVSLARALCLRPRLLLLDEPLAGVDGATYIQLMDDLPRVLLAFKATTIFVTHNHDEALRLANDLVVIANGRVCACGETRDVVTRPRNRTVAEALGCSVLVSGDRLYAVRPDTLRAGAGQVTFELLVDDVLDLIHAREMLGRVGDTRVRVRLPRRMPPPRPGERTLVHAEQSYPLQR